MQPQLIAGRYQVVRSIGHGGMGTVWLCRDEVLGRRVAVKQISALGGESATETKRAMREARSAAALNHPNAVAVFDVVNHDGRPWLVMEYVEGQTLADEIPRDGHLSPRRVADIGAQLAGALASAHARHIVHRDIKPANVLIDRAGHPKISDFGIARGQGDDQLTAIGFVTGTPGFLSPELARGGDPHPASDVWALGATLYAAVEGQPPYEPQSNPIAMLRAIATDRPRPMTHAGALGPAIDAMMEEDPARRWDMATSAKRLGVIADLDATAVMPRVDPAATVLMPLVANGTEIFAAPPVEPTQRLEAAAYPEPSGPPNLPPDPPRNLPRDDRVPPQDERRTGRGPLALAFVAMLVAAFGIAFLLSQLGERGGSPEALTATATTPATTPAQAQVQPTQIPPTSASRVSEPPVANSRADRNLESFVSSYYASVTKHRDRTWDQLTPRMQDAAGGRDGYDDFWRTISKVEVNQTQANAAEDSAVVNLTFTREDGTTSTETHQLTFVTDDRDYRIASDQLLG